MHIVLGLLTTIVTVLYLLDRMGIDLGGLNPFYWYRRRAFARKYGSDPIYSIQDPMHGAALLVIGTAKLGGDLTASQKATANALFVSEFSIDSAEASQLFGSAAHLLAAPQLIGDQLQKLLERSTERFSREQAVSIVKMAEQVAAVDGGPAPVQSEFLDSLRTKLPVEPKGAGTWD